MLNQTLMQVREISVRVSRRRDSLIHLHHVDGVPRHIFTCESTQHLPWSVPTTDGHDKSAASNDRSSSVRRHESSSFLGDLVSIAIDLNFHQSFSRHCGLKS